MFFVCFRIGALAKYRCERGYKIIGEPLVTCEENGLWSGQVPECICEYKTHTHTHRIIKYRIIIIWHNQFFFVQCLSFIFFVSYFRC